jgi:hypothetical protein
MLGLRQSAGAPPAYRAFDPVRLGTLERDAWAAYYQREWFRLLGISLLMVRVGFGMSWLRTCYGAALVVRGNQLWAPHPDNDPDGAIRVMGRFYRLVARAFHEDLDATEAARLEVAWWREHRLVQRSDPAGSPDRLVVAISDLYAFVYDLEREQVRPAAEQHALALAVSDRWVAEGCVAGSPLLLQEAAALVRCYALLLAVVHR